MEKPFDKYLPSLVNHGWCGSATINLRRAWLFLLSLQITILIYPRNDWWHLLKVLVVHKEMANSIWMDINFEKKYGSTRNARYHYLIIMQLLLEIENHQLLYETKFPGDMTFFNINFILHYYTLFWVFLYSFKNVTLKTCLSWYIRYFSSQCFYEQ